MNETNKEALIHLRVPAECKNRWVKLSQKAGQRLTDWIVEAVEARARAERADDESENKGRG